MSSVLRQIIRNNNNGNIFVTSVWEAVWNVAAMSGTTDESSNMIVSTFITITGRFCVGNSLLL